MKNRRAKVVYSYAPQNDDELKLEVDEVIEVLDEIEDGWWKGISPKGITGVFPSNFVVEVTADSPKISKKTDNDKSDNESIDGSKSSLNRDDSLEKKPKPINKIGFGDIFAGGIKPKLTPIGDTSLERNKNLPKKPPPQPPAPEPEVAPKLPPKPVREQALVLYSYVAQNEDELSIKEGEIINLVSKDIEDVGWWKGELNGRIALFPDNFVEIIKTTDESSAKPSPKKPGRPAEKPPPPVAASTAVNIANHSKTESNKTSNKPAEELPKSTTGSNVTAAAAPVIPVKKPKVLNSSIFQSKPKAEPTPQTPPPSRVKPDVVPQENGSKSDADVSVNNKSIVTANNSSENNFVDSTTNKLTHLTANRPKGPSSRRPPSTIFIPKDSGNESKENGDISMVSNKSETNTSHTNDHIKPSALSQTPPVKEVVEKLPPWMLELRKAQEKRKENPDDSPKGLNSPTKSTPNRFSGDFTSKLLQNSTSTPDENDSTSTPPLFKPLKSTKPSIASNAVTSVTPTAPETPSPVSESPRHSLLSSSSATTAPTSTSTPNKTNIVINSSIASSTATTTTPTPPKVEDSVSNSTTDKRCAELERQLRELKESTVSRKDFDELSKQVTELREAFDTQKQTYSKTIRDLINDVADEQKKVATLQIEIDRLRKLTTTV